MDNIAVINKTTGKVVATHQSFQNITIEEHYPPESYGDCEIVVLPKGCKVDYETMADPRKTVEQITESKVLTKAMELETADKTDYKAIAIAELTVTETTK